MSPSKLPSWALVVLLGGIAALILILDQLSKAWVISSLPEEQNVPIWGEFLSFYFVRNSGAAFSLASGSTWIFSLLAIAVVIVIIVFARKIKSLAWACVFGLLLGGTLGNLTDRLTKPSVDGLYVFGQGHVIDFISTPWMMPAVYNIADIAIVSSMVLLVLLTLFGIGIDGTREKRSQKSADGN